MDNNNVSLDLMEFVEKNILPQYADFDKAHNMEHVVGVIRRSLQIARNYGADINMVYVVAAYHDLGLSGPRAIHHITSGKILQADKRLKKWFSQDQINRASTSHVPRSLYGKIVAEADRDLEPMSVFRRTVQYGMSHYPEMPKEEQWKRFVEHMNNKYSENGYVRLWIKGSPNEKNLRIIREIIADPDKLRKVFEQCYEEECGTN